MNKILPSAKLDALTKGARGGAALVPLSPMVPHSPAKQLLMRRYEVHYLTSRKEVNSHSAVAPAMPLFEAGFAAFARGTVLKTTLGPCAIEDLEPGMQLETAEYGPQPVLWRGAISLIPNMPNDHPESQQLTRITSGAFGPLRPDSDLMLGPSALMLRPNHAGPGQRLLGRDLLVNGDSVFSTTPPSPVQVYHICLPQQASFTANGLQFASYHPGADMEKRLGPNMRQLFLSLFPHLNTFEDFGAALQGGAERVRKADLDWV